MTAASKLLAVLVVGAMMAVPPSAPAAAHGRGWGGGGWGGGGWGGFGVGLGLGYGLGGYGPYYASPYYYAPPVVYVAPPVYAPPPPYYYNPYPAPPRPVAPQPSAATASQSCNAGSYVCPLEIAAPAGNRCYCPGNDGARVYGTAQ